VEDSCQCEPAFSGVPGLGTPGETSQLRAHLPCNQGIYFSPMITIILKRRFGNESPVLNSEAFCQVPRQPLSGRLTVISRELCNPSRRSWVMSSCRIVTPACRDALVANVHHFASPRIRRSTSADGFQTASVICRLRAAASSVAAMRVTSAPLG